VEQLVRWYVVAEASLPALVTVSNDWGRHVSNHAHIMAANRKRPTLWKATDLALDLPR